MAASKQSKQSKPSFGGIKIREENQIASTLLCELCKLLLFHPTQLLCCGTRLCRWCSKQGLPDSEPFICPFCHTIQAKKLAQADRGVERELNMIELGCYWCPWNGSFKDYQVHLQEYHADFECNDCHARFFAINSYEEHRQDICEYRTISCGLSGCTELMKPSEIGAHYLCTKHQLLLIQFIVEFIFERKNLSHSADRLATISNNANARAQELAAINESVDLIKPGLELLSNDSIRLRTEHDQSKTMCDKIIVDINQTSQLFNQDNEKFNQCVQSQKETEKEIENTKKLYASSHVLSLDTNSVVIFAFHKQRDDMHSAFSIFSSTFKTAPFGYFFTLRVCSTIINDNHQYLSIYITLLRGDFDQILFFPFPYNIFLYLHDQSGEGKHIISIIKSDPKSPSFARPSSEKNNEIGISEFCSLHELTNERSRYLKDGVFFIRIYFDFMNTGPISIT